MNEYVLRITEAAEKDLNSITDYIAFELRDPSAAWNQIERIQAILYALRQTPERYGIVQDPYLAQRGVRKIPIDHYLVFYTVDSLHGIVTILRVLYGRRDWEQLV